MQPPRQLAWLWALVVQSPPVAELTTKRSEKIVTSRQVAVPIALATAICAAVFLAASTWTGDDLASNTYPAVYELVSALPWVGLWLAAAGGLGILLRVVLRDALEIDATVQFAAGIALLLVLDAALGALGVLQNRAMPVGAWVLTVLAIVPVVVTLVRAAKRQVAVRIPMPWFWPAAAPAVAILLLAACSAPGWLWESEFGGYDALSYHLQLPKEWMAAGAITPLQHNVYSFLPSYMEAAYYHVMLLRGSALDAVIACQLLHAAIAVVTALAAARLVMTLLGGRGESSISAITAAVVLGTPWVVIVGTLAYNELPTALMLAAALTMIVPQSGKPIGRGIVVGLLMAAAVGAKPTAVGFVVLPVTIVLLWRSTGLWKAVLAAAVTGALCISPWLVRNALHGGNPVFPFAAELLGSAHWTAEQVTIWNAGHHAELSFGERIGEAFNQLFRYGLGSNPDAPGNEPWQPQWSVLPWLGIAGAVLATTAPRLRRPAMLLLVVMVVQMAFWLLFTHIKSRFMLPMVVPASCGIAIGVLRLQQFLQFEHESSSRLSQVLVFGFVAVWCLQPALLYRAQRDGAPSARIGWVGLFSGTDIADDQLHMATGSATVRINRTLPRDARVMLVGDAAPLYYTADVTYTTVWDRGPMSAAIAAHPDEPARWMQTLRKQGFSHVLVSPTMLRLWQESRWRDPLLDPDAILRAAERHGTVVARFADGSVLFAIGD